MHLKSGETRVRDAYEAWAMRYDSDRNRTRDLDAAVLRATPLALDSARVVEIGAGTGKNTAYLAARAGSVLALDVSGAMLARARERVLDDHVRFLEHDVTRRWPVRDAEADVVVGNLVLEHICDLRPVFSEAARALRPGGEMFLCEFHPYRQLRGKQARFEDGAGATALVEAYPHSVSEYVNSALDHGFALVRLGEWLEQQGPPDPPPGTPPRLLSMLLRRTAEGEGSR